MIFQGGGGPLDSPLDPLMNSIAFLNQHGPSIRCESFKYMTLTNLPILNLDISSLENSMDPDLIAFQQPADMDLHCFSMIPLY